MIKKNEEIINMSIYKVYIYIIIHNKQVVIY